MRNLGYINVEGGPLLLIDASDRENWNGIDGCDYDRACILFDNHPNFEGLLIDIGKSTGLLWETSGPGTVEVFLGGSSLPILIRAWLNDYGIKNQKAASESFSAMPVVNDQLIGNISIYSGSMMILWATENASGLDLIKKSDKIEVSGELAIENSVLAIETGNGKYKFIHSAGENEYGSFRILIMSQ